MKSFLRVLLLLAAVLVVVDALKVGWMEYTIAGTSVVGGAMVIAAGFVNSWYVKNGKIESKKSQFSSKSSTFSCQTCRNLLRKLGMSTIPGICSLCPFSA
jgi:hypothetical protein